MAKLLRYSEYQPRWQEEFKTIKDHLDFLLGPYIEDIVHVGSTSVVSLPAKPIIDMNIVYTNHFETIKRILESNGYEFIGERGVSGRSVFRPLTVPFYEHHLYATLPDNENFKRQQLLKRALQNNGSARKRYAALKKSLIEANNQDRGLYTDSKTDLIETIMKEESLVKTIIFAGGCFWGVEAYFKQLPGVLDTEVGYIDGNGETNYKEVCAGSGHAEAVLIRYEEEEISLKKLLDHLFNIIDPTSINKQGPDTGIQYRTGIYNYLPEQLPFIEQYLSFRQREFDKPFQLQIKDNLTFYPAEDYHQDYLDKNKNGYCHVDLGSYTNVE